MSIGGFHILPSDVRQVIDRTDTQLSQVVERLAVIAEELSEQNALMRAQNELLRKMK